MKTEDLRVSFYRFPEDVRRYLSSEALSPGDIATSGMMNQALGLQPECREDYEDYERMLHNLERMLKGSPVLDLARAYLREVISI